MNFRFCGKVGGVGFRPVHRRCGSVWGKNIFPPTSLPQTLPRRILDFGLVIGSC
ncbi:MAG: hypothetical protein SWZ49_12265 [Cyanobacteriota bacterium]|nr:hypothetical protein [Cyanobacteriota bacterium]